jgi:hypothetical protein
MNPSLAETIPDILMEWRGILSSMCQFCQFGEANTLPGLLDRIGAAYKRLVEDSKPGYSPEDIRICYMNDFEYAMDEARAVYPEVFFNDCIDLYGLAKTLREIGKNPSINLAPCNRGVVMQASFILAKQAGWRVPDIKPIDPEPKEKETKHER